MECEIQYAPTEAAFISDLSVREVQKAFDEGWFDLEPRQTASRTRRVFGLAELIHLRIIKDTSRHIILQSETKKQVHRQLRARMSGFFILFGNAGSEACLTDSPERQTSDAFQAQFLCKALAEDRIEANHRCRVLLPIVYSEYMGRRVFFPCRFDNDSANITSKTDVESLRPFQSWSDQCSLMFRSMTQLLKEPVRVSEISIDALGAWQQMIERLAETTAARLSVVSDPEIRGGEPVVRGTRIPVHLLSSLVEQGATNDEILSDYPALDEERLRLSLRYAQNHPRLGRPKKRPWHNAGA